MPHEIKVGDMYQDEKGKSVRIICTDRKTYKQPVVGLVNNGECETIVSYTNQGISGSLVYGNLILPESYDDWQIDDPIWVWEGRIADALPHHFAGINEQGRVLTWRNGATSHSAGEWSPLSWRHASKTDPRNSK
jgi:hypothetical protein